MAIFECSRKMTETEQMCYKVGYEKGKCEAVVHGRWIGEHGDECDQCNTRTKWFFENFCPKCGAKMDT